jgi:DNA-binding XRE family transcriptional regulator
MSLQIIKSIDGKDEYVLLPVFVYNKLHEEIEEELRHDYVLFDPADYVDNPVALARIKANITQEKLAQHMGVTQAYISKIEQQRKVTLKVLQRVEAALQSAKLNG